MRRAAAIITGIEPNYHVELHVDPSDVELEQLRQRGATILEQVVERKGSEVWSTWRYEHSHKRIVVRINPCSSTLAPATSEAAASNTATTT